MSNLYVVDSTGTTRAPTKVYVVDAGGVSRYVQKIWAVDSTNTTRLVFNAFTSALYTFTAQGAAVVTIPSGALQVVIEGWGSGNHGGAGYGGSCTGRGGGGGGAGGYFRKSYTLSSANWSKNFNVSSTIAGVGSVTVSSGTFSLSTLTANIGQPGGNASSNTFGSGGIGGTSSGGDINTQGGSGSSGQRSSIGGDGGTAVTGLRGTYGSGGVGGDYGGSGGGPQTPGAVVVYFT